MCSCARVVFGVAVRVRRHGLHAVCRTPARCPPDGTPCWRCPSPTNKSDVANSQGITGRIGPATSPIPSSPILIAHKKTQKAKKHQSKTPKTVIRIR